MRANKTYLNVTYAEKDAAKALGARWDPDKKKWYVPPDKELAPFAQWLVAGLNANEDTEPSQAQQQLATESKTGVFTYPASAKNFVAYAGSAAPWE